MKFFGAAAPQYRRSAPAIGVFLLDIYPHGVYNTLMGYVKF